MVGTGEMASMEVGRGREGYGKVTCWEFVLGRLKLSSSHVPVFWSYLSPAGHALLIFQSASETWTMTWALELPSLSGAAEVGCPEVRCLKHTEGAGP